MNYEVLLHPAVTYHPLLSLDLCSLHEEESVPSVLVKATAMKKSGCGSKSMHSVDCQFVGYLIVLCKLQMETLSNELLIDIMRRWRISKDKVVAYFESYLHSIRQEGL
jgi:hypothetical protein